MTGVTNTRAVDRAPHPGAWWAECSQPQNYYQTLGRPLDIQIQLLWPWKIRQVLFIQKIGLLTIQIAKWRIDEVIAFKRKWKATIQKAVSCDKLCYAVHRSQPR